MKANSIISTSRQDNTIVFRVRGVAEPIVFDPDKVSAVNRARAMIHGFTQRIADGAAMVRSTETGLAATPQDKADKMRRIAEHLMAGGDVWELRKAEGGAPEAGLTLRAMMRAFGRTLAEVEDLLARTQTKKALDRKGALAHWLKADKVAQAVIDLRSEAAAASPLDADAELEEMMSD